MKINVSTAEVQKLINLGEFDAEWYREEYPDVNLLKIDPAQHYLWIGQRLGRSGSRIERNQRLRQDNCANYERFESSGYRSNATYLAFERDNFIHRLREVPEVGKFHYEPLISVLLPAYKSPIRFLDAAVRSVIKQSYQNWELIIVDDGSNLEDLTHYLTALPSKDRRIHVQINAVNTGISSATNDCLSKARGEFIALFDHDDVMTLDALSRVVSSLNTNPSLDLIYSDECRVDETDIPIDMFRKPDWSPAMLYNYMYTGHLSVYRRSIVERVGQFRSKYDFSQDYDLALRVTEVTNRIHHIPEILYGWRAIVGSGAAGGKDFARESNIAALQDAISRQGLSGEAVALPTANRVDRRAYLPSPLVSIIIPSDNASHIAESIESISSITSYENYEIVIVTNSKIVSQLSKQFLDKVHFVAFDKKFNFSEKCNEGASKSRGEFYCFFNDDVRPQSCDWIEALLEYGLMSDVGAVGAKLLYENKTIQHAGMITGVRNLIGTAFHCLPADTSAHFNMAQCVRDVTLLCGALILMPRSVFHAIGGWDQGAFAIAHSDTDLCLKVWDAGLRCVYTPYATLIHIGHVSLGHEEAKYQNASKPKQKAEVALLRRWPEKIADDPFFPHAMVRAVYHDAQEYFRVYPGARFPLSKGRDILIACHELTQSGAPLMAFETARHLLNEGHFVVVIAPHDGPMREAFTTAGITVIVDELLFSGHSTVKALCSQFDVVIANTIVCWPLVSQIMEEVDVKWYIHESEFLHDYIAHHAIQYEQFSQNLEVWAVTSVPAKILREKGWSCTLVTPGIPVVDVGPRQLRDDSLVSVVVIGGYEPRKGQDLACAMLNHLSPNLRHDIRIDFFGRVVDQEFHGELCASFKDVTNLCFNSSLDRLQTQKVIQNADIVLVPSRDESFSLVVIEALQQGALVVCSEAVGVTEFLENGKTAFIAPSPAPHDLAVAMQDALTRRDAWSAIRESGASLARSEFSERAFRKRLLKALAYTFDRDFTLS